MTSSSASSSTTRVEEKSSRPPGPRSCAMCTTAGPHRPIGCDPTRSSRAKWIGRTATSPRRSAPRKCGIGTGSTRAPSRLRPVRCTPRSGSGCHPRDSGLGVRGSGVRRQPPSPEPLTPSPQCPASVPGPCLRVPRRPSTTAPLRLPTLAPDPAHCAAGMEELRRALDRLSPLATSPLSLGVSPHAPYTVSEPLYRAVADLARRERCPLAMHLAESRAETELVRDGSGPFADALRARGFAVRAQHCSPVRYLLRLGVLQRATGWLCIHCVQVDERDVAILRDSGAGVAHCPRSNRAHGHGTAPLAAFRRAGLRVGLGTDSVVSVGDSSLLAEAAAAGLDGEDALRMLTIEGARALGLEDEIGSLEVGKQADLAVFPSTALFRLLPPVTALLTLVPGRVVHG